MAVKKIVEAVKKATTKKVEEVKEVRCAVCNGTGRVSERVSCEECQGTGLAK